MKDSRLEANAPRSQSQLQTISRSFLAGLAAVLPLVLTLIAVLWAVRFVAGMIGPGTLLGRGLRELGFRLVADERFAYLLGWAVVLAGIFVLGVFVKSRVARFIQGRADALLGGVPILGGVYGTAKQLTGMLSQDRGAELEGMSVVHCQLGAEGGASLLGLLASPECFSLGGRDHHVVLVPTAPVPITGGLLLLPVERVHATDLSLEAFTSIFVSMGVKLPEYLEEQRRRAAPGLEHS